MGYSSTKPHGVPLLPAKNRKIRLQFCTSSPREDRTHINWSEDVLILIAGLELKNFESVDTACLVLIVQASDRGLIVCGII